MGKGCNRYLNKEDTQIANKYIRRLVTLLTTGMLDGNNGKERCGEAGTLIRFEEHGVTTSEEVYQFPTVKHWFILCPSWTLAGINPKRNKVYALAKIYIKAYIIHDNPWKPKFLLTD